MNRRKTIKKSWSPLRLLSRQANRRLRSRTKQQEAQEAQEAQPAPAMDLRRMAASVLGLLLFAVKVVVLLVLLCGAVIGGYYTYQRVMHSTYFHVTQIDVRSTRRAPTDQIHRLVRSVLGQNILSLDLGALRRAVQGHPWVRDVRFERELPHTLRVQVTEHRARALLLMGHLYLVNREGQVFKRADADESVGMPVITGISRMTYLNHPATARQQITKALDTLDRYYARVRSPLSEVHVGEHGELTLHLKQGGGAVRVGDEMTNGQLKQMDAVWAALGPEIHRARVVFLDNVARPDRVTVRMGDY